MHGNLKPLENQTVVITGASSGIGLTTARMAAERGANVVAAARSEDALRELTEEIRRDGGRAAYVVADVTDRDDVREITRTAVDEFGGFDTWVNGAGAFIYGRLRDVPVEDMRRQFDVNVWGLLYGSLEAAEHFRERGDSTGTSDSAEGAGDTESRVDAGAIINIGSVVSDRSLLYQGSYSASKHAVKGFTDALRMELEHDDAPVSVSLVKPSAIDTPYPEHAKNYMDEEATLPPPVYAPETVARTILHCAENPERDVTVGAGGKGMSTLGHYAASTMDTLMEKLFSRAQRRERPSRRLEENSLDKPMGELETRGDYEGHVAKSSLYTRAALNPVRAAAALVGAGVAGVAALYARRRRTSDARERKRGDAKMRRSSTWEQHAERTSESDSPEPRQ